MGIDIHGLNFLQFALRRQRFTRVATIGRQGLYVTHTKLKKLLHRSIPAGGFGPYCEQLFIEIFSASVIHSFDNSDFEAATFIHDMNKPLITAETYDTVIDLGCLEHIFDVPQALRNVSLLCSPGGQILHVLPANNFCGHGFWQFSPELFFSLYSHQNGYANTRVFMADLDDEKHWYEVMKPTGGRRVEILSSSPIYVLVRTSRMQALAHTVQQSDYAFQWQGTSRNDTEHAAGIKSFIKQLPILHSVMRKIKSLGDAVSGGRLSMECKLSSRNRNLRKIEVSAAIGIDTELG